MWEANYGFPLRTQNVTSAQVADVNVVSLADTRIGLCL